MDLRKFVALGVLAATMVGCNFRFKGGESFTSATVPNPAGPAEVGDPYAAGGLAEATGGLIVDTQYNAGARPTSDQKIDPLYNRPAYGSGQRRGESGSQAAPGHAYTNAPAFQAGPNTGAAGNP